ncbi:MAG: hypothetical protein ACOZBH_04450 [Patescibacteria group bacterium]
MLDKNSLEHDKFLKEYIQLAKEEIAEWQKFKKQCERILKNKLKK